MASAEAVGNMREVRSLIKTLGGKTTFQSTMPAKDLQGDTTLSSEQLLAAWNTFLSAKFSEPVRDKTAQRESTVSEEDPLTTEELEHCLNGMREGKAPGIDDIPIEAYKYSPTAKAELFRIIRLIWDSEDIPPDLVRGVFIMLYNNNRIANIS